MYADRYTQKDDRGCIAVDGLLVCQEDMVVAYKGTDSLTLYRTVKDRVFVHGLQWLELVRCQIV
jgi:hypothetical protein